MQGMLNQEWRAARRALVGVLLIAGVAAAQGSDRGPGFPREPQGPVAAERAPESYAPSATNFAELGAFIRPNADELRFEDIGWRNAFWPAIQEARALGRPVLLWTMNGHPLGCT
jgi:hypothetical protein